MAFSNEAQWQDVPNIKSGINERKYENTNILAWSSYPGLTYRVEHSHTLGQSTWVPSSDTLEGNGSTLSTQDSNPARLAKLKGFYRLKVE